MSKGKYYFSKSLEKGLKILALFNGETPVMTQSEIAKALGLNMTSTYRYINTLVELGLLDKDPKTREIRPSVRCLLFCTNLMRATDRLRMIKEVVDRIHRENNISIDVALVVEDGMTRLYHREAEETLIYSLPDIARNCLHNTALGKAYLSSLPPGRLAERIEGLDLVVRTGRTIVDRAALEGEVRRARTRGFAVSEEEYLDGLVSIGAPIRDPLSGEGVGAVSFDFSVLQHGAAQVVEKYGETIVETAERLSALLPPGARRR